MIFWGFFFSYSSWFGRRVTLFHPFLQHFGTNPGRSYIVSCLHGHAGGIRLDIDKWAHCLRISLPCSMFKGDYVLYDIRLSFHKLPSLASNANALHNHATMTLHNLYDHRTEGGKRGMYTFPPTDAGHTDSAKGQRYEAVRNDGGKWAELSSTSARHTAHVAIHCNDHRQHDRHGGHDSSLATSCTLTGPFAYIHKAQTNNSLAAPTVRRSQAVITAADLDQAGINSRQHFLHEQISLRLGFMYSFLGTGRTTTTLTLRFLHHSGSNGFDVNAGDISVISQHSPYPIQFAVALSAVCRSRDRIPPPPATGLHFDTSIRRLDFLAAIASISFDISPE